MKYHFVYAFWSILNAFTVIKTNLQLMCKESIGFMCLFILDSHSILSLDCSSWQNQSILITTITTLPNNCSLKLMIVIDIYDSLTVESIYWNCFMSTTLIDSLSRSRRKVDLDIYLSRVSQIMRDSILPIIRCSKQDIFLIKIKLTY